MKRKRFKKILLLFGFLLGISDGRIALWKDGQADPVKVFPYRAETLHLADQQALENGIHLDSKEDLIRLLEDYLS